MLVPQTSLEVISAPTPIQFPQAENLTLDSCILFICVASHPPFRLSCFAKLSRLVCLPPAGFQLRIFPKESKEPGRGSELVIRSHKGFWVFRVSCSTSRHPRWCVRDAHPNTFRHCQFSQCILLYRLNVKFFLTHIKAALAAQSPV